MTSTRSRARRWRAAGVTLAVALLAGCGAASAGNGSAGQPGTTALAQPSAVMGNPGVDPGSSLGGVPAPGITLRNQFGQLMSLHQFRGKVVILAFADSQCTTVCPLTTMSMVEAKQLLGAAGSQVQLLGRGRQPARPPRCADVMAYSRAHGMVNQWDFLTGLAGPAARRSGGRTTSRCRSRLGRSTTPRRCSSSIRRAGSGKIYLTQMSYASIGQAAQILADEAARLLPGRPHVASQGSLASIPGLGPAAR